MKPLQSYSFAKKNCAMLVPENRVYTLLYTEATSLSAIAELQRVCPQPFALQLCTAADYASLLAAYYDDNMESASNIADNIGENIDLESLANAITESKDLLESVDDAPIIKLINALFTDAVKANASDIHIETYKNHLAVRYRVDGILKQVAEPKRVLAPLIISRIKIMSKLDIAEKRIPQDGRISLKIGSREVDVRVSTLPSPDGERIVLRLLNKQASAVSLRDLGMPETLREALSKALLTPHGIFLVTGPTGSGKTTTLYAGLSHINSPEKNILTIEDPIEYRLPGVGQSQVNTKTDFSFARGLRAILRQDPDVVMVGEIRDRETVDIAIQASLTGHLVLSTLHTNTAIGAVTRLVDLGIEPFLLASSLVGIVSQRLVRKLCPHCKSADTAQRFECDLLPSAANTKIYRAVGCAQCNHSGFAGRTGIYEYIPINSELKRLINLRATEAELLQCVRATVSSIRNNGFAKVLQGVTTLDEVLRVTQEES